MRINQNIAAQNAYRNLSVTNGQMGKSLEKLSSGFRINRAADDAAGLAISEGLRSQIGGLKVAARNAQDGISVVQTAEGALTETHALLQRVRDLAVQSANTGANSAEARSAAAVEVGQALKEIDRIGDATKFGGNTLLNGDYMANNPTAANQKSLDFHVGSGANAFDKVSVNIGNMKSGDNLTGLKLGGVAADPALLADGSNHGNVSITKLVEAGSDKAITRIDDAIKAVSTQRASLGATQNRLEHTIANLSVTQENLSASESRIRDTDMAQEMVSFTRAQILTQAGTSMLAQANQAPQGVLSLLR
jgi:flagellin